MTVHPPLHEQQTTPLSHERKESGSSHEVLVPGEIRTLQAPDNEQAFFRVGDTPLAGATEPDLFNFHPTSGGEWVLESTGIDPQEPGGQWKVPKDVEFTIGDKGIYMRLRGEQEAPRIMGVNKLPLVAQRLVAHALRDQGNRAITLSAFDSNSSEGQSLTLRNTGAVPLPLETHAVVSEHNADDEATQVIERETIAAVDNTIKEPNSAEQTPQVDMTAINNEGRETDKAEVAPEDVEHAQAVDAPEPENLPQQPAELATPVTAAEPTEPEEGFRLENTGDILGTHVPVPEKGSASNVEAEMPLDIAARLGVALDDDHETASEARETERVPVIELENLTPTQAAEKIGVFATKNLNAMSKVVTEKYEALAKAIAMDMKSFNKVPQTVTDAFAALEGVLKSQTHELGDTAKAIKAYIEKQQERVDSVLDAAETAEQQIIMTKAQQLSGYLETMAEKTDTSATTLQTAAEHFMDITTQHTNPELYFSKHDQITSILEKVRTTLTERGDVRRKANRLFEEEEK